MKRSSGASDLMFLKLSTQYKFIFHNAITHIYLSGSIISHFFTLHFPKGLGASKQFDRKFENNRNKGTSPFKKRKNQDFQKVCSMNYVDQNHRCADERSRCSTESESWRILALARLCITQAPW